MRVALLSLALLLAPGAAFAQVGGSTDIIIGKVIGPDSQPLANAKVLVASVTTRATKATTTRADGRFTVLFRDGGGQYRVLVTFLGMRPANVTVQRQADEDRLVVNVHMSQNPQQLSTVEVRGRSNAPTFQGASAGGMERTFPPQLLERMPINPGDLEATATLVPGVVALGATDSTRASFSVAGQPASQNNITVDGMSFLFGSVPQDAVRQTNVVLNAYDVSRGQFTGGQIATTTKSGTDLFQGTANFTGRPHQTQWSGSDAFGQKYADGMLSAGAGGPIRKGHAGAYYFASAQAERRSDDALSLSTAGDPTLARLGVSPDSVQRFYGSLAPLSLMNNGAPLDRTSTSGSALTRLDFDMGDAHQLMLRGDVRGSRQEGSRVSPYAIPNGGGTTDGVGGGGMAMLTSVEGPFINEARIYASADDQSSKPYLRTPSGAVTVASTLDARQQLATLQFGGSQFLPRKTTTSLQEGSDELSWITESGAHRLKLGVLLNRQRSTVSGVSNRYGLFFFNSLADLDSNRPSLFARTLAGNDRQSGTDNAALYLGDAWRYSPSLQLVYGVRMEGTRLPDAPLENPAIESTFGRRTDDFPTEVHASPRFGLTYLIGNVAGIPSGTLRMGVGEFRGNVPSPLVGYVASNNGLAGAQQQVVCVGSSVPTPDWPAYLADTASIPSACVGGPSTLGGTAPNVALFGQEFGAPRVWRASVSVGKRVFTSYGLGVNALYAYGVHSPSATDLNLVASPSFFDGARPVYAPQSAIVPSSGAVALAASRLHPQFGTVFDLGSGVRSRTTQVTTQLTGGGRSFGPATIGYFSVGYTYMRALDESNGYPFANAFATTAGDPRATEWGTSDLERRHSWIANAFIVFPHALEFSLIGHLVSGPRYTPMVGGDVNGDGVRNDRALVDSIPAGVDSRALDCLTSQLGRVATRNSCTTPWTPGLDMQVNWRPNQFGLARRVTLSLVAVNTLAGVDELVHGASGMRGWGQPVFPDRNLYTVTGFTPSGSGGSFRYAVNQHFGSSSGATNPFRIPFQLGLYVHLNFGVDPQREALRSIYGTADGRPPAIPDLKSRIYRNFPLPIKMTLEAADSLKLDLTEAQLTRLRAVNDSLNQRADTLVGIIAQVLAKAGDNPDPGSIAPRLQKSQTEALAIIQRSAAILKETLTPEQWAKLPDKIRFPLQQAQGGQGNRPSRP